MRAAPDEALHFSSRRSKWLDDNTLLNRGEGKETNWKRQYKLRYNWSVGACEVQEIHLADRPSVSSMLVRLAEGVVVTADKEDGLRAWSLKEKELIATCSLEEEGIPTCLAVDEQESGKGGLDIVLGFKDGGWGTWRLDIAGKAFKRIYRHPASSNGLLSAVAYSDPYVLTITEGQLLSLYSFTAAPPIKEGGSLVSSTPGAAAVEDEELPLEDPSTAAEEPRVQKQPGPAPVPLLEQQSQPRLLASLKSHTSWPPLSLSIRTTASTIIASIAYSLPTYLSGYTIGLQELHLSPITGLISSCRLTSALPQGFSSLLSPPSSSPSSGTSTPAQFHHFNEGRGSRPTTLSYSHPYILATHPDNTLTLYLCTSTASSLTITPGTKLWGHTSSVSSAEITPRGKAVSVSTRGNELRAWELEGGLSSSSASTSSSSPSKIFASDKRRRKLEDRSVWIRPEPKSNPAPGGELHEGKEKDGDQWQEETEERKRWVGFDDEMVIVLKESGRGTQALMVYDFT